MQFQRESPDKNPTRLAATRQHLWQYKCTVKSFISVPVLGWSRSGPKGGFNSPELNLLSILGAFYDSSLTEDIYACIMGFIVSLVSAEDHEKRENQSRSPICSYNRRAISATSPA
jgi:hypothetical protein